VQYVGDPDTARTGEFTLLACSTIPQFSYAESEIIEPKLGGSDQAPDGDIHRTARGAGSTLIAKVESFLREVLYPSYDTWFLL